MSDFQLFPAVPPQNLRENDALLFQKISDMERSLEEHVEREEKMFADFMGAFPDGPMNHKNYHQSLIDAAKSQQKFWDDLRLDLAKKGIWAILTVLVGLVITGIATKIGMIK